MVHVYSRWWEISATENRQSQAIFHCTSCGHRENADLNAARNILAAGQTVLPVGILGRMLLKLRNLTPFRAVEDVELAQVCMLKE